jgi:hypothetical protein
MLARLYILLPYTLTVPEGEEFPIYEMVDGEYRVRFLPPLRDPAMIHGRRPEGLTLNGETAFEANVMRIDFCKEDFDRTAAGPIDPPEDVIRRAVSEFHARLRFTTRAAHAQPVSFPWSQWRLEYTNEVFISVLLDRLASRQNLDQTLWEWTKERDGKWLQQPSVEEQFDVLLKYLTGHSLKEEAVLWEAFRNLRSARNSFVHEGEARVGNTALTKDSAAVLVARVNDIVAKVREWIPEEMRWPVPQAKVTLEWTQMLIEPSNQAVQPTPDGAADR